MENQFEHVTFPLTSVMSGQGTELRKDVYYLTVQIVNVCFIGDATEGWVLVDAGMPNSASMIINGAMARFGDKAPTAIILTHGHFDHVGAIVELVEKWNVPVYAHVLELPYLTGKESYPTGDPSVGGGLVSLLSPLYPNQSIQLGNHVQPLPDGGSVPGLSEWRWIHTPGHTPGHISLYRDVDRTLVAGDAFTTVKQESIYNVVTQTCELSGPPAYFTTNWEAARESVERLAKLEPLSVVTGHGQAMYGDKLITGLKHLAARFSETEIPKHGRFVH